MSAFPRATPIIAETRADRLAREKADRDATPGILGAAYDAASLEWMGAWQLRQWDRLGTRDDPDFRITDQNLEELGQGISPDLWPKFGDATSLEDARVIRDQLLDAEKKRQRLAKLGWGGTALRIGASILDPEAIALMVASDGLAGEAVYGAKLTRAQRFIRGGFLNAGTAAGLAAYDSTINPTRDVEDVLWAGLGGFILGGGINAALSRKAATAARGAQRELEAGELVDFAMGAAARGELNPDVRRNLTAILSEKGKGYFAGTLDEAGRKALVDDVIARAGFDEVADADILTELRKLDPADALQAFHAAQDGRRWADIVREVNPRTKAGKEVLAAEGGRPGVKEPPAPVEITEPMVTARAEELMLDFPRMKREDAIDAARRTLELDAAEGKLPPAGAPPETPPPPPQGRR